MCKLKRIHTFCRDGDGGHATECQIGVKRLQQGKNEYENIKNDQSTTGPLNVVDTQAIAMKYG